MIKCKDCKNLKETELGGHIYFECLKIYNVLIYDKDAEHSCKQFESNKDVDFNSKKEFFEFCEYLTGHDKETIEQMYLDWGRYNGIN